MVYFQILTTLLPDVAAERLSPMLALVFICCEYDPPLPCEIPIGRLTLFYKYRATVTRLSPLHLHPKVIFTQTINLISMLSLLRGKRQKYEFQQVLINSAL
ncbi:hypothetical protein Y032_0332g2745 [Ancylostoma ceylanicum]|uniref:Uncharacterized protein n=1 Tax=Ancylostoma ceylanicum TaxID=53326 RepID=A0A016RZB3_9BILA|nr:hypothetical protein Y032_0332g2745 [Ancylostoma ceylanicum]